MTGPEHYREAERLLAQVAEHVSLNYETTTGERKADVLAAAQAHATLALAAATAAPLATAYDGDEQYARTRGWAGVA